MIICDTHCDTLYNLATRPGSPLDVTMENLVKGGVSLQTLAMYVGKGRQGDVEALFAEMFRQMELLEAAGWRRVDDPSQAVDGQVSVMLSIEGCEPFDKGLQVVEEYRCRGVRMAAVTWNPENTLAYPALSGDTRGLKPYGLEAVRLMQKIGIAVDVSHLNDAGVWEILEKCGLPPMASHSNCRALVNHPRNLSDDLLRAIFEKGGYVGVNFWPTIVGEPVYDLFSPLFDEAVLKMDESGRVKTVIRTQGRRSVRQPLRRVTWNGQALPTFQISHARLAKGGQLVFWY